MYPGILPGGNVVTRTVVRRRAVCPDGDACGPAGRRGQDLVNHLEHLVKIAGIDHAGLGSDYDGVIQVPT